MPSYLKVASHLCVGISALFALAPSYIAFVHFRYFVGDYFAAYFVAILLVLFMAILLVIIWDAVSWTTRFSRFFVGIPALFALALIIYLNSISEDFDHFYGMSVLGMDLYAGHRPYWDFLDIVFVALIILCLSVNVKRGGVREWIVAIAAVGAFAFAFLMTLGPNDELFVYVSLTIALSYELGRLKADGLRAMGATGREMATRTVFVLAAIVGASVLCAIPVFLVRGAT